MILRLLKSNQAYHFILIPLIVAILWIRSLILPEFFHFYQGENSMLLYQPIHALLGQSAFANNFVALIFVVLLAFIIIQLNTNYAFIRIRTFLPANIFVLIVSGLLAMHTLHPVYFGLLFLLLSVNRIFQSSERSKVFSNAFDAGFLLGIGSLFYFNLIFYFPIIWVGFSIIRKRTEWRNYVLPVLGILLPWFLAYSYYFLFSDTSLMLESINQNFLSRNKLFIENIPLVIFIGFLIFSTLLSSIFLLSQYDEKKINTRKYFQIFFLIFIISLVLLAAVPSVSQEILIIMAFPLTCLVANYLIFMKRQFWGNVFLYVFIALVIYLQFV